MKFGQKLALELTESWKENYIQYDQLKCMTNHSKSSDSDSSELELDESQPLVVDNEKLIETIRNEIKKVDSFYRITEIKIKEEIQKLEQKFEERNAKDDEELYFTIEMLKNFACINFTGFERILKKIENIQKDKVFSSLIEEVQGAHFNQSNYLDKAQSIVIKHHSMKLMNGNRKKSSLYLSKLWSDDPRNQPRIISERVSAKTGFIIDMDGVIYHGNKLLPGAIDFVNWLKKHNKNFLFLTNSSSLSPKDLQKKLLRLGISVNSTNFYTSSLATANFLASQTPNGSAYVVGDPGLVVALYEVGYSMNDVNPDYVVIGETRDYNFARIEKAVDLVRNGARLIGTNIDVVDKKEGGFTPACGSLMAPIEAATGVKAYFLGKPNPLIIRSALEKLGCRAAESCIIGDRMDTDIIAGIEASIDTVLVLSGVTSEEDIKKFAYRPNIVLSGVGEVPFN